MIFQTARLRVNDGKGDDFVEAAKAMVSAVRERESGRTLQYDLLRSASDPNSFMFLEAYADAEAMQEHGRTPHMAEFGGKLRGILAGRLELERFEPLT